MVRILQRYDGIDCAERPRDARIRFHHTIENRSGTGVQVRLHRADDNERDLAPVFPLPLVA